MSDFLGRDLKLDSNFDLIITPDGNFTIVEGAECVAQDIKLALAYNDELFDVINNDDITVDEVQGIIEGIIIDDPRVDPESVIVSVNTSQDNVDIVFNCDVSFTCITDDNRQNLVFVLNELISIEDLNYE